MAAIICEATESVSEPLENVSFVDDDVHKAAHVAVIETSLGDLEELAHDVESSSIYALRGDNLSRWSFRMRNVIQSIRSVIRKKDSCLLEYSVDGRSRRGRSGSSVRGKEALETQKNAPTSPVMNLQQASTASFVSGTVYLLLDSLGSAIGADWGQLLIYQPKTEELVLACSVGRRAVKPGTIHVPANLGVEGQVLSSGIAINVAHAYAEEEFSPAQDQATSRRTQCQIVFPVTKPNQPTFVVGVVEFCNKTTAPAFTPEDECRVAECLQFLSRILWKYPNDITNPACFDPTAIVGLHQSSPGLTSAFDESAVSVPALSQRPQTMVFRTARAGHIRRSDIMRDGLQLSAMPTITEALAYITKVNDGWRDAVLLNIELEREIKRLQEALRISHRETTRLQGLIAELRGAKPQEDSHSSIRPSLTQLNTPQRSVGGS